MPTMRAPLGAQDVIYKDPNATVQGTRAAAFSFLGGSAVLILRARGTGGFWEPLTLAMGASRGNSEVLVPMFFLHQKYYAIHP